MANTTNYAFIKPLVGGSDNAWGGNLNDNFDKLDKLLGGDEPVEGINIESGSIDGSLITGELGKPDSQLEDDESPLEIHEDTHLNGKVNILTGMTPDASDDNDKGEGLIQDCVIKARDLEVDGYVAEGSIVKQSNPSTTFNPNDGTIQYMNMPNGDCEFTVLLSAPGEQVTVILYKSNDQVNNIEWKGANNSAISWIGSTSPDLDIGYNVIQLFSFDTTGGVRTIGAFSGIAS